MTYGGKSINIETALASHLELVDVLKQAKLGLEAMVEEERCGDTFVAVILTLDRINNVLNKVGE